jgi:hypothetical protein
MVEPVVICNSNFLEYFKACATFCTTVIAFLAYYMGKKYFNKGHMNSLNIARYNKQCEFINVIYSDLVDLERLLKSILDSSRPLLNADNELQTYTSLHESLLESCKKGQFIYEVSQLKTQYLIWYAKWFEKEDSHLIVGLFDPQNRMTTLNQVKDLLSTEFEEIMENCRRIYKHIEPNTDI